MAFEALDELLDDSLTLPLGGRRYTVPAPSARVGIRVQRIVSAAGRAADGGDVDAELVADEAEEDLYTAVLGSAYDAMVTGGVSWPALKHASITAMVWIAQDKATAERFWNSGGDPSRMAPNRRACRSAGANTTKNPASTNGTNGQTARRRNRGRTRR